jgi:hypothetical protein
MLRKKSLSFLYLCDEADKKVFLRKEKGSANLIRLKSVRLGGIANSRARGATQTVTFDEI